MAGLLQVVSRRAKAEVDLSESVEVRGISGHGPASEYLKIGDYILKVDRGSAYKFLKTDRILKPTSHKYQCYRDGEEFVLKSLTGIDLGISTSATHETALRMLNHAHSDEMLFVLWLKDRPEILEFSRRRTMNLDLSMLEKLRRDPEANAPRLDTAALLFQGVGLLQENKMEGLRYLRFFADYYSHKYADKFKLVVKLYEAKYGKRSKNKLTSLFFGASSSSSTPTKIVSSKKKASPKCLALVREALSLAKSDELIKERVYDFAATLGIEKNELRTSHQIGVDLEDHSTFFFPEWYLNKKLQDHSLKSLLPTANKMNIILFANRESIVYTAIIRRFVHFARVGLLLEKLIIITTKKTIMKPHELALSSEGCLRLYILQESDLRQEEKILRELNMKQDFSALIVNSDGSARRFNALDPTLDQGWRFLYDPEATQALARRAQALAARLPPSNFKKRRTSWTSGNRSVTFSPDFVPPAPALGGNTERFMNRKKSVVRFAGPDDEPSPILPPPFLSVDSHHRKSAFEHIDLLSPVSTSASTKDRLSEPPPV